MKRRELPENENCLITIMDRYGCDKVFIFNRFQVQRFQLCFSFQPQKESYAGGNLAVLWLQNERYLIHSAMKKFDCQLCKTLN